MPYIRAFLFGFHSIFEPKRSDTWIMKENKKKKKKLFQQTHKLKNSKTLVSISTGMAIRQSDFSAFSAFSSEWVVIANIHTPIRIHTRYRVQNLESTVESCRVDFSIVLVLMLAAGAGTREKERCFANGNAFSRIHVVISQNTDSAQCVWRWCCCTCQLFDSYCVVIVQSLFYPFDFGSSVSCCILFQIHEHSMYTGTGSSFSFNSYEQNHIRGPK